MQLEVGIYFYYFEFIGKQGVLVTYLDRRNSRGINIRYRGERYEKRIRERKEGYGMIYKVVF